MGDITKNISQYELDCKCGETDCNVTILSYEPVIQYWQDACDYFAKKYGVDKVKLIITSGGRCYTYNRLPINKGGAGSNDNSRHPRCNAIDGKIYINGNQIPPKDVYDYFDNRFKYSCGIGLYNTFTHLDTRTKRSRW
jgi:uncharacterized protein YcbK (DUF882 family)